MTETTKTRMIERRVSKGYNAAESAALLEEIIASHDGDNLAHSLQYNGFTR